MALKHKPPRALGGIIAVALIGYGVWAQFGPGLACIVVGALVYVDLLFLPGGRMR